MPPGGATVLGGAALIAVVVAPFVARASASPWLIVPVAAMQVAALAWLLGRRMGRHRIVLAALTFGLVVLAVFASGLPPRVVGLAAAGSCHAAGYAGLLAWFAASLRPGREPVVTGFARRVRRTMPDKVVRYTRQVTRAWCVFFAAELGLSAGLLALAPEPVWSGFVDLVSPASIAAMMLGEFALRSVVFRHEPRTGLAAMLADLRHFRSARP